MIRQKQAEAGDIVLLYQDESEALTHPYLSRLWAKRGADLRIEAPGKAIKCALLGVHEWGTGELTVHTSRTKRSTDFICLLETVDVLYGPGTRLNHVPVVLVLDNGPIHNNGPIHTSHLTQEALAARAWLTVEWLPKYAPELNVIERDWLWLKRDWLANQLFDGFVSLECRIHWSVAQMNAARTAKTLAKLKKDA